MDPIAVTFRRSKWQPTPVFLPGESQGRGAWWAAVYGVAQSRTGLKRLSSSSCDISPLSHPKKKGLRELPYEGLGKARWETACLLGPYSCLHEWGSDLHPWRWVPPVKFIRPETALSHMWTQGLSGENPALGQPAWWSVFVTLAHALRTGTWPKGRPAEISR